MIPTPDEIKVALSQKSLRKFLERVTIDASPTPKAFGQVADPWQWEKIFDPIIPAIERLEGLRDTYFGPLGFWRTMPRGHDKTSSIARLCSHVLAFSPRRLRIGVAARDKGQAQHLRNSMDSERRLNPWYADRIKVDNYQAEGPGGELEILSADEKGAFGGQNDIIVVDELTHWTRPALWVALVTETIKRAGQVFFVITNAGYYGTWQRAAFEEICKDPTWDVWEAPGLIASWMTPERVHSARNVVLATTGSADEVARLMDNVWLQNRFGSPFDAMSVMGMIDENVDQPFLLDAA